MGESDVLVITPESYSVFRHHRDIADRVMDELRYDPLNVTEIRVSEGRTEVDWLWRDASGQVVMRGDELDIHTTTIRPRTAPSTITGGEVD